MDTRSRSFDGCTHAQGHRPRRCLSGLRLPPLLALRISLTTTPSVPMGVGGPSGARTNNAAYDDVALRRAMKLNSSLISVPGSSVQCCTCPCLYSIIPHRRSQQHQVVSHSGTENCTINRTNNPCSIPPDSHFVGQLLAEQSSTNDSVAAFPHPHTEHLRRFVSLIHFTTCRARGSTPRQGGRTVASPYVHNGVAMCATHHRAFDADVLGIRPDYVVQVRDDVLEEHDGPTLRHTLQGVHGEKMQLPRQRGARPDPILLEERFERFRKAS